MTTPNHRPPLVLIAEHDDVSRRRLQGILSDLEVSCELVRDEEECVGAYMASDFDLVLVASDLPDSGPTELCRRLARSDEGRDASIVLIVSPDEPLALEELAELGVIDYLQRPVSDALAKHVLRRAIVTGANGGVTQWQSDGLLEHLREAIPVAQACAKHVAVLYLGQESSGGRENTHVSLGRAFHTAARELARGLEAGANRPEVRVEPYADDFVAVVSGLDRVQDAAKIAGRVQDLTGAAAHPGNCIGISAYPQDGVDPERLVEFAHAASMRARLEGRTSVEYYTESMSRWALERLTLENSLRNALENDELVVYYQPRVDITSRRILGMEALVRWIHPQLGLVSPGQFIPLAEETGLIGPIGEWVLREACRQNREWRDRGYDPIRVSVNLSPLQFRQTDLAERVCAALADAGLAADGLELEVTESMLMHDPKATIAALQKIKRAGITISIDDFGTGYSSLSYLKQFPIDALKIDRSFVRDITTNPDDAAIATAIILMGNSLKLEVVAEGVETESQMAFLQVLQCDEIQGYLISPPVPSPKAERLLAAQMPAAA